MNKAIVNLVLLFVLNGIAFADGKIPKKLPRRIPNLLKLVKHTERKPYYQVSFCNKQDAESRLRIMIDRHAPLELRKRVYFDNVPYMPYIVDKIDEGWFVLYRENPDEKIVPVYNRYKIAIFGKKLDRKVLIDLNKHFLKDHGTEVQDARYRNRHVYFNEACESYSSELGGECSTLVCLDPYKDEVVWRTPYLVSNDIFIFKDDDIIVAGYGFTAEPDFIYLVDAKTGKVLSKTKIDSAHEYLEVHGDELYVFTYKSFYLFKFKKLHRYNKGKVGKVVQKI